MMKGQFFLLGALLLIILFFVALPRSLPTLREPSNDLPLLADNILREYPIVFNFGLNSSNQISLLRNFTSFVNETLADRNIRARIFWVFTNATSGYESVFSSGGGGASSTDTINLTVGNFLGENTSFKATETFSTNSVTVGDNATYSTNLIVLGSLFNITLNFSRSIPTVEWVRDKGNLYVYLELERGGSVVRKELSA